MVVETVFSDVVEVEEVKKFCPLVNDMCRYSDCMWFLSDGICAVARIAVRLDVLVEGVPIVKVWED